MTKRRIWLSLLFVLIAVVAAPFWKADQFSPALAASLERALQRKVEVGSVRLHLLTGPGFTLSDVVIHEDPAVSAEPLAYVTSLVVRLRSAGSLIQTIGRAARNLNGRAILYADVLTDSMKSAIDETSRRRRIQQDYNEANGITPQSISKPIDMTLVRIAAADYVDIPIEPEEPSELLDPSQKLQLIATLEEKMKEAARHFEFEKAAQYRDRIKALKSPEA